MNAKMTKAFNAIKSTLSADYAALKTAGTIDKSRGIKNSLFGQNVFGTKIPGSIQGGWNQMKQTGGAWGAGARLGGYGAAGAAGTAAAADFLNPWGLGWGD